MEIKKHLELLGLRVEDKVTEVSGIVNSISFDLFGCIQADVISEKLDKDGKMQTGYWLDVNRLKVVSKKPVMNVPAFDYGYTAEGKRGAADKPRRV